MAKQSNGQRVRLSRGPRLSPRLSAPRSPLQALRFRQGRTQEQVAAVVGISARSVGYIEAGTFRMDRSLVGAWAKALGTTQRAVREAVEGGVA